MAKLYPPYIEGTIPAFYGDKIIVPYSMNRAVSVNEIAGFSLKIKTVQNNYFIATVKADSYNSHLMEASFNINTSNLGLNVGQYYKMQLAYIDKQGEIGYYSTVGIVKYTAEPEVRIEGLEYPEINNHTNGYIGYYSQKEKDPTEKVYSYNFKVYNSKDAVIAESGEKLHNSTEDTYSYESIDNYELLDDLNPNESYYIQYTITTTNKLVCSSRRYRIVQRQSINSELNAYLTAELNYEEGYIDINLIGNKNEYDIEEPAVGAYVVARASKDAPNKWEVVYRFRLESEKPTRHIWRDCTIEQGKTYIYSLQQYNNNGLFSNRMLSNEVYADFEDAFLFDGRRQLKIKYNPKVSSFKNNILETKVDTIGSKYPFIFRNGKVKYKEFPISGLISYFMDEANLFMDEQDYMLQEKTTNLINSNQTSERLFKLEVLDWLTNGEAKLFRSPKEGNYLVRLMNTSLTPIDTVGRMLHSFNCTAYEVAPSNYDSLNEYNIIEVNEMADQRLRWKTVELLQRNEEGQMKYFQGELLTRPEDRNQNYIAQSLEVSGLLPGDYFYLNAKNPAGKSENELAEYKIIIGATGAYKIDSQEITSVYITKPLVGTMTFTYYGTYENTFNMVSNVEVSDVPGKQFIGEQWTKIDSGEIVNENLLNLLQDVKTKVLSFAAIRIEKRPVEYLFVKEGKNIQFEEEPSYIGRSVPKMLDDNNEPVFFRDKDCVSYGIKSLDELDSFALYQVRLVDFKAPDTEDEFPRGEYYYIDRRFNEYYPKHGSYLDGNTGELIPEEHYSTDFYYNIGLNNQSSTTDFTKYYGIDLNQTNDYTMYKVLDFKDMYLMNGVMATMIYQIQTISYLLEEENEEVSKAKNEYLKAEEEYFNALGEEPENISDEKESERIEKLKQLSQDVDAKYNIFIEKLELAIKEYKEAHAIPYEESVIR